MDDKPFETMNVIPFIDVMLVLLVLVLMTATFVQTGRIPVALPQASSSQLEKKESRTIEITSDGTLYFDDAAIDAAELEMRLSEVPPETGVLIRADKTIELQKFINVADILKRLKFESVAVQTQTLNR